MSGNHVYLRNRVNNWERTNRTRLIQSIIISAMFCWASLTNVCNVLLNSKAEHTIEDALLRYVELRTSLMFYWRSCKDAETNLKSLSPFVTSYLSARSWKISSGNVGHLGGLCWRDQRSKHCEDGEIYSWLFSVVAQIPAICSIIVHCNFCNHCIVKPQLYIFKGSAAFEDGYLKTFVSKL